MIGLRLKWPVRMLVGPYTAHLPTFTGLVQQFCTTICLVSLAPYPVASTIESHAITGGWNDQDTRGHIGRQIIDRGLVGRTAIDPNPYLQFEIALDVTE